MRVGPTNMAQRILLIIKALLLPFLIAAAPKIDPIAAPRVGDDPINELYKLFLKDSSASIPNYASNVVCT